MNLFGLVSLAWLSFIIVHKLVNGRFWIWEFVSLIPPVLFGLLNDLLLIANILVGNYWIGLLFILIYPLVLENLDVGFGNRKSRREAKTYKLFNWNTEYWVWEGREDFYKFLIGQDADIYHLQEALTPEAKYAEVVGELHEYFPGYDVFQTGEMVTLTRLKVVGREIPDREILRTDVDLNGQIVSLYNVHIPVHLDITIIKTPIRFLKDVNNKYLARRSEYQNLWSELVANEKPLIFSGDFNTSTMQAAIRPFLRKYRDSFRAVKIGFPTTFAFKYLLKFWRIDYVMGQHIRFHDYKTVKVGIM